MVRMIYVGYGIRASGLSCGRHGAMVRVVGMCGDGFRIIDKYCHELHWPVGPWAAHVTPCDSDPAPGLGTDTI